MLIGAFVVFTLAGYKSVVIPAPSIRLWGTIFRILFSVLRDTPEKRKFSQISTQIYCRTSESFNSVSHESLNNIQLFIINNLRNVGVDNSKRINCRRHRVSKILELNKTES